MRAFPCVSAALIVAMSAPVFGQAWTEFTSREDGFQLNFPGTPTVTEKVYKTEFDADLPARVYTAQRGQERYSATVVDYRQLEPMLTERSKKCPPFADERCTGYPGRQVIGAGYWMSDMRGALVWASSQFMKRDAKVTDYYWNYMDFVEGHQIQLTNLDRSRTFASIFMHMNRLYILEGTVPEGAPEPALFQQSLGFVDQNGNRVRYQNYYDNDYPAPPREGTGAN